MSPKWAKWIFYGLCKQVGFYVGRFIIMNRKGFFSELTILVLKINIECLGTNECPLNH